MFCKSEPIRAVSSQPPCYKSGGARCQCRLQKKRGEESAKKSGQGRQGRQPCWRRSSTAKSGQIHVRHQVGSKGATALPKMVRCKSTEYSVPSPGSLRRGGNDSGHSGHQVKCRTFVECGFWCLLFSVVSSQWSVSCWIPSP